jgi:hypothetical protein
MEKTQNASLLENSVSGQRNTFFGWNFQDILMMIRSIYGENFRAKIPLFDFLLSIEKMVKNSVKSP